VRGVSKVLRSPTIQVCRFGVKEWQELFLSLSPLSLLCLSSSHLLEGCRVRKFLCRRRRDGERGQVGPVEHDYAGVLPLHWSFSFLFLARSLAVRPCFSSLELKRRALSKLCLGQRRKLAFGAKRMSRHNACRCLLPSFLTPRKN
jgi:hypothetical protein